MIQLYAEYKRHLRFKDKISELKDRKKDIPCKQQKNKTGVAILLPDKTDIKTKLSETKRYIL